MVTHSLRIPRAWYDPSRFLERITRAMLAIEPRLTCVAEPNDEHYTVGRFEVGGAVADGLLDDFFVVQSEATGRFKLVDFQDCRRITDGLYRSELFAGAAVMMFHPPTIAAQYGDKAHLIYPGWFLDQAPGVTLAHRARVADIRSDELDDRLFFRGTIHGETPGKEYLCDHRSVREVALVLREKYPDEVDISGYKMPRSVWFGEAARHRWVLTLPGHPWCYREFEMASLGISTIALRWTSFLYHQPIHYVAVDGVEQHPIGFALDPEAGADAIIAKFRLVRRDENLSASIGAQAQRWYDAHCSVDAIAADVLNFLDLEHL